MLCIASFFVLAILGIFSASYRKLALKAWHCVLKKVTFKPCDINFSEEIKGKLLGKMVLTHPKLAKFLNKWIDVLAFIFVVLTIWSLITAALAGLNLWVYDTCDPVSGESCSLSGEACGVEQEQLSFPDAIAENRLLEWMAAPFVTFGETVSRVPDRLKTWKPEEYLSSTATFYFPEDKNKPYAIEAIDPGCRFCKKLFENIKTAGFEKKYNLTYLLYPIPDKEAKGGYKFSNSYLMASYVEAVKKFPLPENYESMDGKIPAPDWLLLEKIFTGKDQNNVEWQTQFNMLFNTQQAEEQLQTFLKEIGYSESDIEKIAALSKSEEVKKNLNEQKDIVENKLKTIKIPTILFDGRRFDRVVESEQLK